MRLVLLAASVLAFGCERKLNSDTAGTPAPIPTSTPKTPEEVDVPPLHSEKGVGGTIEIEHRKPYYHRLVVNGILLGTQVNHEFVRHWADDFTFIAPGSPWSSILAVGTNAVYNPRLVLQRSVS